MQNVSDTFLEITGKTYRVDPRLDVVNASGTITFGADKLYTMKTTRKLFSESTPSIGGTVSGEIDATIILDGNKIDRMAKIIPYVRVTDGDKYSEWIPKGHYWIDTRSYDKSTDKLTIHGYDAMLRGEQSLTTEGDQGQYPRVDADVVADICDLLSTDDETVELDDRTSIDKGYTIQYPGYGSAAYTAREILGYIGTLYGGNWAMTDSGKLRLIALNGIPVETYRLIDEGNNNITFGGDYIIVG